MNPSFRRFWPFVCCALCLFLPFRAAALDIDHSLFCLDVGGGIPQLLGVQGSVMMFRRMSFGAGFGIFPGAVQLGPHVSLTNVSATVSGDSVTLSPAVGSSAFHTIEPFMRFFLDPDRENFYLQLSFAMLKSNTSVSALLTDPSGKLPQSWLYGNVYFTQYLPTIAIGHLFATQLFFINFNMGVTFLAGLSSQITLGGSVGGISSSTDSQASLAQLSSAVDAAVSKAADSYEKTILLIPSVQISVGYMF